MFEFANTAFDAVEAQLIVAHVASGQPRYSNTLYLLGGGVVRRWTEDETTARTQLEADRRDPNLSWAIAFDNLSLAAVDLAFPPHGKTPEQLKAECDEALEAMFDRWQAEDLAQGEGGR
ncbi:hypothetical protein [Caulobacter segnis]